MYILNVYRHNNNRSEILSGISDCVMLCACVIVAAYVVIRQSTVIKLISISKETVATTWRDIIVCQLLRFVLDEKSAVVLHQTDADIVPGRGHVSRHRACVAKTSNVRPRL